MRFIPKPYKIGDIDKHIDETADKHNGFGSKEFRTMVVQEVSPTSVAKAFGISTDTYYNWRRRLEKKDLPNATRT